MDLITSIGMAGATLTTLAFVPQVIKSYKTKHTHDLSLGWMGCLIAGFLLWLVYGWIIGDLPLILANILSLLLVLSLLAMKLKWGMER
jgi:MtN3 and saliva related transmembrane protein